MWRHKFSLYIFYLWIRNESEINCNVSGEGLVSCNFIQIESNVSMINGYTIISKNEPFISRVVVVVVVVTACSFSYDDLFTIQVK